MQMNIMVLGYVTEVSPQQSLILHMIKRLSFTATDVAGGTPDAGGMHS